MMQAGNFVAASILNVISTREIVCLWIYVDRQKKTKTNHCESNLLFAGMIDEKLNEYDIPIMHFIAQNYPLYARAMTHNPARGPEPKGSR